MYIVRSFIRDKLIPAVDIAKFINNYVALKQSGTSFTCCCPFHSEKTPSFFAVPSKQMFYCFGCKEHGNAIDFVKKYKNLSFIEAVQEVAAFAGLEVEYEQGYRPEDNDRYAKYYDLMDRVATYFTQVLYTTKEGRDYYFEKRGLSQETVAKARLGFAPNDWAYLDNVFKSNDDRQKLYELGVLNKNEASGRYYPMFRGRVIIPILDIKGRVISFGGRTLGDDKPKYLNTAESPIYKKRRELFGLYDVLTYNKNRPERFVIVEGYMDVLSLRQHGLSYAVASLGTATTREQIELMFRYSNEIVCLYDGDNAGRKAAVHAFDTVTEIIRSGKDMRFAFLPVEHDPDSLVREKGLDAINEILDNAKSYPEFLISHLEEKYSLTNVSQRASFIQNAIEIIAKISDLALQSICISLLSKKTTIDDDRLYEMLRDVQLKNEKQKFYKDDVIQKQVPQRKNSDGKEYLNTPMRRLIAFILQQPTIVAAYYDRFELSYLKELCSKLQIAGEGELAFFIDMIKRIPDITPGAIIEEVRETNKESFVRILINAVFITKKADGSEYSIEDRAELFLKLIEKVLLEGLSNRMLALRAKGDLMDKDDLKEITYLGKISAKKRSFVKSK